MGEDNNAWVDKFVTRYYSGYGENGEVYYRSSPLTQSLNSISGATLYESTRYSGGTAGDHPVRYIVETQLETAEMFDNFEIPAGIAVFLGKSEDEASYKWNAVLDEDGRVVPFETDLKGVPINCGALDFINFIIKPKDLNYDTAEELINRYREWNICNETYTGYAGGVLGMDQFRGTGLF